MSKDTFKLIIYTLGLTLFLGMLFNGSFAPANVISTDEFETVTGNDQPQLQPDYGDISDGDKIIVDKAIGDLLNTPDISITPPQIKVVSFSQESFSDTSLGCPQEGENYSQVIVDGYNVLLEANGNTYDYRLDNNEQVILCQSS